jgi:hypothetical protein
MNLRGSLTNYYQRSPGRFPIASSMENRLNEEAIVTFSFQLAAPHRRSEVEQDIIIVLRPPPGSEIKNNFFVVRNSAETVEDDTAGLVYRTLNTYLRQRTPTRVEVALPRVEVMISGIEWRVSFVAHTAPDNSVREENAVWVIELSDTGTQGPSMNLGAFTDFHLLHQVNFTVLVERAPPVVDIEVSIRIISLGDLDEIQPNRVDVISPSGYRFLMDCLAPSQPHLDEIIASCRERWSLFNGNYLSSAVLMTLDQALTNETIPVTMNLLVRTPAETPPTNNWYIRTMDRNGPLGWGIQIDQFPVTSMLAAVSYSAIGGTVVPMFVSLSMRYPMPWNGYLHIAGPRTYQLICPVQQVLAPRDFPIPPDWPSCTSSDPVLAGCLGLPAPGDPEVLQGLPACDPLHELLLRFDRIDGNNNTYAISAGTSVLLALDGRVPLETPFPRSQNVFRVRVLDENKLPVDGMLNYYTSEVRQEPRVQNFQMWFEENPQPQTTINVAIDFTFNRTIGRNQELPDQRLRVIEIMLPAGFEVAVEVPQDVRPLRASSSLAVTEWNWTETLPRSLWFGLDIERNVTGRFHYMFPVTTPETMPFNNMWEVRFCNDAPYCTTELLSVPIPGFYFDESPDFELETEAAVARSGAQRRGSGVPLLFLVTAGLLAWQAERQS